MYRRVYTGQVSQDGGYPVRVEATLPSLVASLHHYLPCQDCYIQQVYGTRQGREVYPG